MPKKHLTYQFIESLQPKGERVEYFDQHLIDPESNTITSKGVKGLLVRLTKAGNKYFYYSYWYNGKSNRYKIGDYPNMGISKARDEARKLAEQVNKGIDPQAEKNKNKYKVKEITFRELSEIFSQQHLPTLKKSTRKEYQRIIDNELLGKHKWGGIAVSDITSQHVREVLNHKAFKDNSFTMANRIRSTISKIFDFGLKHVGINLQNNPVENTPIFDQGENVRDRVYNEDEIKELWHYWESKPEPIQSYYKFLLLTGQRRTETMQMRWSDIQQDKACKRLIIGKDGKPKPEAFLADIWTIKDNKSNRVHEVPLSDKAKEILENLKPITGNSDFVFTSPRIEGQPLSSVKKTTENIQDDTSVSDFRLHDLRRTVATKLEESLVDEIVIKKILNHQVEGVTGRHYQWYDYTDKKLQALQRWAWRIEAILSGEERETKVFNIRP